MIGAQRLGRAASCFGLRNLIWALVGLALLLRVRQYLANRSLWLDEAMLAPNVIQRSFGELWWPLANEQAAPIGFLYAERVVVQLFGSSEYALRLFPLLCGLVSVFLFWGLAERLLSRLGVVIALALFAVSAPLVYYASETKQYSSDVAVALVLYCLGTAVPVRAERRDLKRWALMTAVGALAIWFSHPSVFVLGGIGARGLWIAIRRRNRPMLAAGGMTCAAWATSFAIFYLVSLRNLVANTELREFHREAAAPIPPTSWADLLWYVKAFDTIASVPLGPYVAGMVTLAGVLGGVALFRRERDHFYWVLAAAVLACLASSAGKYPLVPRLWLFMAPGLLLFVAAGVDEAWQKTRKAFPLLSLALSILLFAHPLLAAGYHVLRPSEGEEIRPLLEYIHQHRRDGDVLYLYCSAEHAAQYYAERGLRFPGDVVVGVFARNNQTAYARDVERVRGKDRVWFLFSHVYSWGPGLNEEGLILYHLDVMGRRLDAQRATGASVYLYDLRR